MGHARSTALMSAVVALSLLGTAPLTASDSVALTPEQLRAAAAMSVRAGDPQQTLTLTDALLARDPDAARQAVEEHLAYVETSLRDNIKAETNEAIARQRFEHEKSR